LKPIPSIVLLFIPAITAFPMCASRRFRRSPRRPCSRQIWSSKSCRRMIR
jgi:hypothetical protein